ncbi:hypothetical protein [Salinivibrio kushneri]|uniref:hypothetical protein n=1 Tax=Salinivibrio kushneri TaxID=1908198 RepID=UPI001F520CCB|nr:hypothetical protein [Salinivibrio kushneri]
MTFFTSTQSYRCPFFKNPETCNCAACVNQRLMQESKEAVKRAEAKNFASGGSIPSTSAASEPAPVQESTQQKVARQRKARIEESEDNWKKTQAAAFDLAWMQSPKTQPQSTLWKALFTDDTPEEKQKLIKQANTHLNEPVREGEIVVIPTAEPRTTKEKEALSALQEEAKAASTELSKLSDEVLTTVNRHFEVLDHFANESLKQLEADGLPSDYYAYASLGVGVASATVQQHLQNINNVLLEINDLYAAQVAMASKTGGVNYGVFVAQRAELFKKLDGSFAGLSKRSIRLPLYTQVKRNLKLSTKSVIHNADEILESGFVKSLGKRIANVSIGASAAKGVGYVGLLLGGASSVSTIYEACSVDSSGECGKVSTREVIGFMGGIALGAVGGNIAAGVSVLALGVVGVTAAPVIAIATVGSFVVGGAIGGIAGTTIGKATGDDLYFLYEKGIELTD